MSSPTLLDRLILTFYTTNPRPEVIKLTLDQADQISDEMKPGRVRLVLNKSMRVDVLGRHVEWVDTEAESILGEEESVKQPAPKINSRPVIHDLVIEDIKERQAIGTAEYGTGLQAHNGRNALQDAYEEALDMACYIKQKIVEDAEPEQPEQDFVVRSVPYAATQIFKTGEVESLRIRRSRPGGMWYWSLMGFTWEQVREFAEFVLQQTEEPT
jgi:hypothetical protein